MNPVAQFPLTSLATLAALAVYFLSAFLAGAARAKYKVIAPAVIGDPAFERALRAQQNVLEWMPLLLPALWLFAVALSDKWAAILGLVWCLARIGYVFAYGADANKRGPYFLVQTAATFILWLGALIATVRALL